jgi:hypothetical protein
MNVKPMSAFYGNACPGISLQFSGLDQKCLFAVSDIKSKRKQLNLKTKQMHWLLGRSTLPIENKLLLYKAALKSTRTDGIQLWGTSSNSNIEILQRFQSQALRSILNAPWYINNHRILCLCFGDRALGFVG